MTSHYANIMIRREMKARRVGAAAEFMDSQLASGRVAFSLPALVEGTGLTAPAAKRQLLRLGRRVARVSQRFFVIVSPEHYAMGGPPVAEPVAALADAHPGGAAARAERARVALIV